MAREDNKDAQILLEHYKKGLLHRSPNSGSSSGRLHNPSPVNYVDNPLTSPCTPPRVVREIANSLQTEASEGIGQSHPAEAATSNCQSPRFKELPARGRGKGSEVSPGVFYGSPAGRSAHRPPQLIRLLAEIQNDLALQKTPITRKAIWETFPKQEQAIQFADSHGNQGLAVFQYQDHLNGQRRFLTTTYDEFWNRYSRMQPGWRHHYEIIRQGRPCHLYFDLEFNTLANAGVDGEAMVDTLLSITSSALLDVFSLQYESSWTLELDSSTKEKFSRHLVIHIPGAAFKDNTHAGAFVSEICKRSQDLRDTDDDVMRMFILQGGSRNTPQTELFVDLAVYTRNRSFRLPFSSKAGKTAQLLPTTRFRSSNLNEEGVFMDSLICKVEEGCQQLLTFSMEGAGEGGIVDFKKWEADPVRYPLEGLSTNYGKSPFPSLEAFIQTISCIGEVEGRIRSWYHFADYGVVVYNISGNRFCERIGRQHKSNNVMFIVDFRTAGYYQKCHDPDCRGYRSPLRPIPRDTIPPEFPLSTASIPKQDDSLGSEEQHIHECDEWEDEDWWGQVVASMANMECTSQVPVLLASQSKQVSSSEDFINLTMDEDSDQRGHCSIDIADSVLEEDSDWWAAVEREAIELENSTVIRKLPAWPS